MKLGHNIWTRLMNHRIEVEDGMYTNVRSYLYALRINMRFWLWEKLKLRRLGMTREQLLRRLDWEHKIKGD
jgi:hypothetical protein